MRVAEVVARRRVQIPLRAQPVGVREVEGRRGDRPGVDDRVADEDVPAGGRVIEKPVVMTFRPNGSFVRRGLDAVIGLPVHLPELEPAVGDDARPVADEPLVVVDVLAERLAEVVAVGVGEVGRVEVERHVVDDPPPALRPALGLEPLVDAQLDGLDRGLDVGRPGDRRDGSPQGEESRVVLRGQQAADVVGQGEIAAGVLVGVVVEVVLDADAVQVDVRVGDRESATKLILWARPWMFSSSLSNCGPVKVRQAMMLALAPTRPRPGRPPRRRSGCPSRRPGPGRTART